MKTVLIVLGDDYNSLIAATASDVFTQEGWNTLLTKSHRTVEPGAGSVRIDEKIIALDEGLVGRKDIGCIVLSSSYIAPQTLNLLRPALIKNVSFMVPPDYEQQGHRFFFLRLGKDPESWLPDFKSTAFRMQ